MVSTLSTLDRGLRVLTLLVEIESDPLRRLSGISVQQAANLLGVHKSNASRLMQTLVASGWAEPVKASGRGFRLGPAVQSTSTLKRAQLRLREVSHSYLESLVLATGECAHAAVSTGSAALVIDEVETVQQLRVVAGRGRWVPLHCTSAGKVLLAFGLAPVPDDLSHRTDKTRTSLPALIEELSRVRQLGYAVDDEENHVGVRCISAPVFEGLGGPAVGCIGIDGPAVRVTEYRVAELAQAVLASAHDISTRLSEDNLPVEVRELSPLRAG